MKQTIGETVNRWVEEETQPKVGRVSAIRKNSPWYGMSDEEINRLGHQILKRLVSFSSKFRRWS